MIENFQSLNLFSPGIDEIIVNLIVGLICSFMVSMVYRFTYKGPGYSENFVNSLVFLSVITALVIMVIGNNLARAFGLVGALSIIRFRTAIKDTIDIVYIFLSLAIGMAAGVGYHKVAVIGTIFISGILILFMKTNVVNFRSNQYILTFSLKTENYSAEDFEKIDAKIKSAIINFCKSMEMINMRTNEAGKTIDYTFYIIISKNKNSGELVANLKNLEGVVNINLFFDKQNI
ncbi:hypothetical protein MROS_1650 [Melioribacter roseus P3M-2]|uniref:DUF4956 domain-containing protein n=1 Tax=Melioribacter roseus (strain DSM 23840 / JCM 17771 / VKM B-2668 / P3M-2) TaxID=1191523 RepID=I6ZS53_MELRP|nr:DUF4956 domain-containing protein [Melioribacter roseus]AFN74884.1 hypothetical protein MROS_1650 [Melioribacter roseus P3M-2]